MCINIQENKHLSSTYLKEVSHLRLSNLRGQIKYDMIEIISTRINYSLVLCQYQPVYYRKEYSSEIRFKNFLLTIPNKRKGSIILFFKGVWLKETSIRTGFKFFFKLF